MKKVKLGKSDLEVTEIVFGAWAIGGWLWGGADKNDAIKAIREAVDLGMTTIDTAAVYGFGHSEKVVSEAIQGKRDKVQILTKYGLRWDSREGKLFFLSKDNDSNPKRIHKFAGKDSVKYECEQSLKRLNTDYIDLYQIHWPDITTPIEETMEAIKELIREGKVRNAGVCNYSVGEQDKAFQSILLASNQVPYSMVNRGIEKDVIPHAIKNNIGILAYSPLQRGVLTGKITENYTFNEGDNRVTNPFFTGDNLKNINSFLQEIKPIADEKNATLAQLVIQWTIQQPGISAVLVGARNPGQVKENIHAANIELSESEISFINNKLSETKIEL